MISVNGRLFEYDSRLTAFEFGNVRHPNVLIFVGGLTDGFLTVPYVPTLAEKLAIHSWSVIQIQLSSSYTGYGASSLAQDAKEISRLVTVLRSSDSEIGNRRKVGILGHSTGSQDTLYYLSKLERSAETSIDFGILQACTSDREALLQFMDPVVLENSIKVAKNLVDKEKGKQFMPYDLCPDVFESPINAYRWYSLASERGDDDFFSSYLGPEDHKHTFGKVNRPLLVLYSGNDETVPTHVNKEAAMEKFKAATDPKWWSPLSTVVPGASHNLGSESSAGAAELGLELIVEFVSSIK
ncbi:hypothetical protein KL921_001914 [Ogataea angusta]|nr:hypothetical protein KL921_001914 [Ogataea angusta]